MRVLDEPIPPDEELYVALRKVHVLEGMIIGTAIDLQGHSCDRQKYTLSPASVVSHVKGATGYAAVSPSQFPAPLNRPTGDVYFFNADDLPTDANEAHAEIRVHRTGKGFNKNHEISAIFRAELRENLAACLDIRELP